MRARSLGGVPDVSCGMVATEMMQRPRQSSLLALDSTDAVGETIQVQDRFRISMPSSSGWKRLLYIDGFTASRDGQKLLYAHLPSKRQWPDNEFKESVLALLELSQTVLECDQLIICLKSSRDDLSNLIHDFIYVGFTIAEPLDVGGRPDFVFLRYLTE